VLGSRRELVELEKLYRRRWAAFARVAISITGSVDLGTEAVQEGFARAIEQRKEFRSECPLEAWVWRIVVNTARTARTRAAREEPGTAVGAEEAPKNGHRPSEIALWVRNLPERQREAVFLPTGLISTTARSRRSWRSRSGRCRPRSARLIRACAVRFRR
jgi:DNA-directed RNA polymerase specialized sigma24 family protein